MKSLVFKKAQRLLTRPQYQYVFDQVKKSRGIKVSTRYFRAACCRNNVDFPRLGLIITKKNVKNAVDRNRIKRIAREQFRALTLPLQGDIVLLVTENCSALSNAELHETLQKLWIKLQQQQSHS